MTGYQGLGAYASQPAKSNLDRKPGESAYSAQRRRDFWSKSVEAPAEDAWAQHRAQLDQAVNGHGVGLFGQSTAQERAAALGHGADSGVQRVERLGGVISTHVPGGVGVSQVFRSQLDPEQPQVPHLRTGRSSGEGWF